MNAIPMSFAILTTLVCAMFGTTKEKVNVEQQVTTARHGHILTNVGAWSHDGNWIVYDLRSDPAGSQFDGTRIERVNVATGAVELLFESRRDAKCGVATTSPLDDRVVFILGPEQPTDDWQYSASHRRGVIVRMHVPQVFSNLDARDLVAPFTPGALRGGTHVHTFSGDGKWVAFTYEDHILEAAVSLGIAADRNQRNVGVSVPTRSVRTNNSHPRNHDGSHFSVLVTRTTNQPRADSDEISRAFGDAWIGTAGYTRKSGEQQHKAIAFQGHVRTKAGATISEVFLVDLPEDLTTAAAESLLQGTERRRPQPPRGTTQRRLTFTAGRKYPGIQGVRHWLRSSPDGSKIAFLMKSEIGVSQLWTISPNGGEPTQISNTSHPISSAFTWSPDGRHLAHAMDGSVCVTNIETRRTLRLTPKGSESIRPEACVFSPDGSKIAYVRPVKDAQETWNQIFVLDFHRAMTSTK